MTSKFTQIKPLLQDHKSLRGIYDPPADKSITHRALLFAALAKGKSIIRNPLATGDCLSTLGALKILGVKVKRSSKRWTVWGGQLKKSTRPINCGNSGTTMRLLSGILSGKNIQTKLMGDKSLSSRPMKRVIEPLNKMGAKISARLGKFAPLQLEEHPNLKPIFWKTPVASAQIKSAILLAGLSIKGKTSVLEPFLSRDHTERMLQGLGANIQFKKTGKGKPNRVSITGGKNLKPFDLKVPGDFSSASFILSAAALLPGSHVLIRGVNLNETRTGFMEILKRMGVNIKVKHRVIKNFEPVGDLEVTSSKLRGITLKGSDIPQMIDELPILAVVASQAKGKTIVSGAHELRVKETDRLSAIASEMKKLGAKLQEKKDGFVIEGPIQLRGANCKSYGDHRMAMALAVAGLITRGKTAIQDFDCTKVSYANFLKDLNSLIYQS